VSTVWGAAVEEVQMTPDQTRPPGWRVFLRGLALEMEAQAGPAATAAVLRAVGQQMARLMALPAVGSMEALEMEMNAVLAEIGWGSVRLTMNEAERCVVLIHNGLPQIGSAGVPTGTWLAPVLEGLYQAWMGQQPGADESLHARLRQCEGSITICYGRQ
jgi:Cellulose synthase subunit D